MSVWRDSGDDCLIPAAQAQADGVSDFVLAYADMDLCGPCPYFRGAAMPPVARDEEGNITDHRPIHMRWRMNCNFPRDGAHVWQPAEKPGPTLRAWVETPEWLRRAFDD